MIQHQRKAPRQSLPTGAAARAQAANLHSKRLRGLLGTGAKPASPGPSDVPVARSALVEITRACDYLPRPFDLWFGMRNSWIARAMRRVGEPFSHVAGTLDGLTTIEFGQSGVCQPRDFKSFKDAYPLVGVLRTRFSATCQARVVERFAQLIDEEHSYAWAACALIEGVGVARCLVPHWLDSAVISVSRSAAFRLERITNRQLTCSSFIEEGFRAACRSCWPQIGWPTRDRAPMWHPPQSPIVIRPSARGELTKTSVLSRSSCPPIFGWHQVPRSACASTTSETS